MLKKSLFLWCNLLFAIGLFAQQSFTLSGIISDADNGETLIGATVYLSKLGTGTTTNEYGFYSISLPAADSFLVEYSYVGFQNVTQKIFLTANQKLDIELGTGVQLEEVVVK